LLISSSLSLRHLSEVIFDFRLVSNEFINLSNNLRSQLLVNLDSLNIVLNLLNLGGTENSSGDISVAQNPSKGQLSLAAAKFFSDLAETLKGLESGFLLGVTEVLAPDIVHQRVLAVISGSFRDTVVILASQDTASQWGPDGGSHAESLEEAGILDFHILSVEQVVLGLFDDGADEAILVADVMSFHDSVGTPL